MFRDMGRTHADARLEAESSAHLARALASGEYVGWLASPSAAPDEIVGGAGVLLRPFLPRPNPAGGAPLVGREALVVNVYTDAAWRRRGVARRLMEAILAWAPTAGVVNVVLHASDDGRPLYESLGFVPTNEMRYLGGNRDEAGTSDR